MSVKKKFIWILVLIPLTVVVSYDRSDWPHWDRQEGCLDTRHKVLKDRSEVPVKYASADKCRVVSGKWKSFFTDNYIYNARKADIDHLVPLKYAHRHGGDVWNKRIRRYYANYMGNDYHLLIVELGLNRSKGARGPSEWLPPKHKCRYIGHFLLVMNQWGLQVRSGESEKITDRLNKYCY